MIKDSVMNLLDTFMLHTINQIKVLEISVWNYLIMCNYIQINSKSIEKNMLIIESKIRPILEYGFSIAPINKKYCIEYDKTINSWYRSICQTRKNANATILRMIIQFDSTFPRNCKRLLGYYHMMVNNKSSHRNVTYFKQDLALACDLYNVDTSAENCPFYIDNSKCDQHTQVYLLLLDKIGLNQFKYMSNITDISKSKWKKLMNRRQHTEDIGKL